MESDQATRAAVAGVAMAFLTVVLLLLGKYLFGWLGVIVAVLAVFLLARGLQPVIVRWIRGTQP